MRRSFLFSVFLCLAWLAGPGAHAGEDVLVDRLAAEFYENSLRRSQTRNIEAATAEIYRSLEEEDKAAFRENRRREWRDMNDAARHALRGVKAPRFENLSPDQKAPFRRAAASRLGADAGRGNAASDDEI